MTWTSEAAKAEERALKKFAESMRKSVVAHKGPREALYVQWKLVHGSIVDLTRKYAQRGIVDGNKYARGIGE